MARKVEVEIIGDSRSLERAFRRSEKAAASFSATIGRSTRGAFSRLSSLTPALIGAGGFVVAAKYAIGAASDLHEQLSFSSVVFGESAKQVDDWSQTVTSSFGIARREALQMASAFGVMFAEVGATRSQAARMGETMVDLAGDMASATNQSPTEMLQRLQSALAGEAEPLRRFAVFISEAGTKAEAYRDGIAKVGTELSDNQKVLARYNFILNHTAKMQGDFSRTSAGLANLQRALRGQVDALATSLGSELLPYMQAVVGWLVKWLGDTKNQARLQQWFRNIIVSVGSAIEFVIKTFGPLAAVAGSAAEAVIKSWQGVKDFFRGFFLWLQYTGLRAFRKLLEPLTHLPSSKSGGVSGFLAKHVLGKGVINAGEWARQTKDTLNEMLPDLEKQIGEIGEPKRGKKGKTLLERMREFAKGLELPSVKPFSQIIKDYQGALTTELGVHAKITDEIKEGNKALRDRADAIKSAVLSQLQLKQQTSEDRQALQDANRELRLARQIGGPMGIQAAQRTLASAQYDVMRDKLEKAPARLTQGGQFAYAGVTVNVHGVTDPEKVARHVVAAIERRRRHTSTSTRGPTVDSSAPR